MNTTNSVHTLCTILGCPDAVWSKKLGLCRIHYQRNRSGRMLPDGTLQQAPPKKTKCASCKTVFTTSGKSSNHVKFCPDCRAEERRKNVRENQVGIFRNDNILSNKINKVVSHEEAKQIREQQAKEGMQMRYAESILDCIIDSCAEISKYHQMIEMRQKGLSWRAIGKYYGFSYETARQTYNNFFASETNTELTTEL